MSAADATNVLSASLDHRLLSGRHVELRRVARTARIGVGPSFSNSFTHVPRTHRSAKTRTRPGRATD